MNISITIPAKQVVYGNYQITVYLQYMFYINPVYIPDTPVLTNPIDKPMAYFNTCQLNQFDREGYQLLPIEQEYYTANNYSLHYEDILIKGVANKDGWFANVQPWIAQPVKHKNIFLDHSFCVFRAGFDGAALDQLLFHAERRPELYKLISSRAKFGSDFCLDWIDQDGVMELIHIEWDFLDYKEFQEHIKTLETILLETNWKEYAGYIKSIHKEMMLNGATSDQIGDYKAKLVGLPEAIRVFKTIQYD